MRVMSWDVSWRRPEFPDQEGIEEGIELGVGLLSRWPGVGAREHRLPGTYRSPPAALVATLDHPVGPPCAVVSGVEWEPACDHAAVVVDLEP